MKSKLSFSTNKRILVTGAGGAPATNFIRSLRFSREKFFIVGTDANEYSLARSEADQSYLIPECSHKKYIKFLNYIIHKNKIDFVHVQNDLELQVISKNREKIDAKVFLPSKETMNCCFDKFKSYEKWEKAGIKVPKTILINTKSDLKKAFSYFKERLWLREISGAGGKGSIIPKNIDQAIAWLQFKDGWGRFTAAELLSEDSITWMSIWKDGNLIVAQTRKRLYWALSKISPSGVTGVTGAGQTYSDKRVDKIALNCIKAIDDKPNGIFSVDMTYDFSNFPNPTEINAGRFFTTHEFFTKAGVNFPLIYLKIAFEEKLPKFKKRINPLKDNLIWIREVDFLPILTNKETLRTYQNKMQSTLKQI